MKIEWIKDLDISKLIIICSTVIIIVVFIYMIVKSFLKKLGSVEIGKNKVEFEKTPVKKKGDKIIIPGKVKQEKRSDIPYIYYTERINNCWEEIRIIDRDIKVIEKEIWKMHSKLAFQHAEIYKVAFDTIEVCIIENWKVGFQEWYKQKHSKEIDENFESTSPHLEYVLIIKSITEARVRDIIEYIKKNDLHVYNFEKEGNKQKRESIRKRWEKYKESKIKKYMQFAKSTFNDTYKPSVCLVPKMWHDMNIMRHTEPQIREIANEMEEDLKLASIDIYEKILEKEKKIDDKKMIIKIIENKIISYSKLKEPEEGVID